MHRTTRVKQTLYAVLLEALSLGQLLFSHQDPQVGIPQVILTKVDQNVDTVGAAACLVLTVGLGQFADRINTDAAV
jgi:hypothetical protein